MYFTKRTKLLQEKGSLVILRHNMENQDTATAQQKRVSNIDPEIKEMLAHALHLGHRKSRQNPKMKPYIFGVRNSISVIDLEQTKDKLALALSYLTRVTAEGKTILFVDTRPSTRELTRQVAQDIDMPHVTERWSGGVLTNWKSIASRIEHFKDLEARMSSAEYEKYTKKERHKMQEEAGKLNLFWGGIKQMTKLPDALFVVDMQNNALAIKEARANNIPIVAIADTNVDPTAVDYPIPANDGALSSVRYILERVKNAIIEGKAKK